MQKALRYWIASCALGGLVGFMVPWFSPEGRAAAHVLVGFLPFIATIVLAYWIGREVGRASRMRFMHWDRAYNLGFMCGLREHKAQEAIERERAKTITGTATEVRP